MTDGDGRSIRDFAESEPDLGQYLPLRPDPEREREYLRMLSEVRRRLENDDV